MKKLVIFLSFLLCNFIDARIVEIKSISEIKNIEKYELVKHLRLIMSFILKMERLAKKEFFLQTERIKI